MGAVSSVGVRDKRDCHSAVRAYVKVKKTIVPCKFKAIMDGPELRNKCIRKINVVTIARDLRIDRVAKKFTN
ncbi:hypothetical protein V6N12_040495 [Hibiscus sabdariffa]|uniref:Uncharacterized protein n=1 Tax=Hibiscus sabdariffa TaxID=183260 RepID=A0ABR2E5M7_9ROSI